VGLLTKFLRYRLIVRVAIAAGSVLVVSVVFGLAFVYEPLTRNVISQDALCNNCHLPSEYNPDARLSATRPHPAQPDEPQSQAKCVECHLPEGRWNSTYAYTHFFSLTDLFGYTRDLAQERSDEWIPPRAATAYRVRDRLFENDSSTCRSCHVEAEIKPTRTRGINAHKLALEESKTCIECHNNLVHRRVDLRADAFKRPEATSEQPIPPPEGGQNE